MQKGDLYTARLTLDITPAMRARIKVSAFTRGVTVAELLRDLLERSFPGGHAVNASASTAHTPKASAPTAAPPPAPSTLAGQAGNVPLTRVALAYIEPRFKLYLRFGEPARTLQLDRWRRCACRTRFCAASVGRPTTTARSAGSSW